MSKVSRFLSVPLIAFSLALAGCGGLSITPNNDEEFKSGYPVYAPMIVVNVDSKMVCVDPDKDGKCPSGKMKPKCLIGTPYLLPDYKERYIVDFKRGMGSYTGTIAIKDGWLLDSATSTANPAAFLTAAAAIGALGDDNKCPAGIYRVNSSGTLVKLELVFLSEEENKNVGGRSSYD